ncbi:TMV resistance protein N-like [Quercus lobata]|uniref:TMV resistance protein N-like n=1 Tax=Quercus lobata TaxID=97700 RepID=UPI001245F626|nr:TMV resistance protein N-like [Quercus lobata]XP_030927761.1 TMV resistance protein N-like [Quercus lobata]
MVSKKFEACSFIEDVREKSEKDGLLSLQQKIISDILMEADLKIRDQYDGVLNIKNRLSHKRILHVLDDIDVLDKLNMLAGEHDWFGPGSRIIISTRDVHVLEAHGVDRIYEVQGLNEEDAVQLFCLKAFKKKHVLDDYLELSNQFLKYSSGLPLALEVLGSFLFGKSTIEWKIALDRLKEFPEEAILRVLRISFNGLQKPHKEIFLHIACFFNHEKKDHVVEKLDGLGLYPGIGLKELIDKSLLKIMDDNIVWMHELLEKMGRNIVSQECPDDPGKRSRLWHFEGIDKMLRKNKGTGAIKAIDIWDTNNEEREARWNPKAVLKMSNLKFLRLNDIGYVPIHFPNDLRILDWSNFPLKSLPSSFQLDELVQLYLIESKIEQLWIGIKIFEKLKYINLTYSWDLITAPDFTGVSNLEKLILESCGNLCKLHPSIGILKKLIFLNLRGCKRLNCLPSKFGMEPIVGNMECLKKLVLDDTAIMELPSSVGGMIGLTSLTLRNCKNLVCLPSAICSLKSLESLDLSGCSKFDNLPENLGNIEGLKKLYLSGTIIKELPSSIEHLTNLTSLTLHDCYKLVCLPNTTRDLKLCGSLNLSSCSAFKNLPKNPRIIEGLEMLDLSRTAIEDLPLSIERLTRLTLLSLKDCKALVCLPSTICILESLESLDLSGCSKFDNLPESLGNVKGLKKLDLSGTAITELPSSIEHLTSLTLLSLKDCKTLVCLPSTICSLKSLESLDLSRCSKFDNLPKNPGNVEGLKKLDLSGTAITELPSSTERLTSLTSLTLHDCNNLECLPNTTCGLKLCGALDLSGCSRFKNLSENLWIIEDIKMLDLSGAAIEELPSSIERLTNLTKLTLKYCINLVCLPSTICSLKLLNSLDLFGCLNFNNLPENIGNIIGLEVLNLCWTAMKEFPSSIVLLKNLKQLHICGWKLSEFYSQPASLELMDPLRTSLFFLPTSLQSLTYLYLSDCNLSSIPNDIGCLSSLEYLDLSGNNFDSLPESMSQLYNLLRLFGGLQEASIIGKCSVNY